MIAVRVYYSLINIFVLLARIKHYILFLVRCFLLKTPFSFYLQGKNSFFGCIQNATKNLSKIPKHVSIVIVEDDVSIPDIALMIVWCFALGISFISICDGKGLLLQAKQSLEYELQKHKRYLMEDFNISLDDEVIVLNQSKQNHSAKYEVHLLSPNCGKQFIVEAAKSLSHETGEITSDEVDCRIIKISQMSEPALAIKCGKTESILGFCPWQLRFTEILPLSTHHSIQWSQFLEVFERYSSTHQRWGK